MRPDSSASFVSLPLIHYLGNFAAGNEVVGGAGRAPGRLQAAVPPSSMHKEVVKFVLSGGKS